MSSVTMNSIVLNYGDSPLVDALMALANSEKRRAEHARQSFDYDGKVVWDNGLNPFVVDPATFLYIPATWDAILPVEREEGLNEDP
jgi:hypothetical protein